MEAGMAMLEGVRPFVVPVKPDFHTFEGYPVTFAFTFYKLYTLDSWRYVTHLYVLCLRCDLPELCSSNLMKIVGNFSAQNMLRRLIGAFAVSSRRRGAFSVPI